MKFWFLICGFLFYLLVYDKCGLIINPDYYFMGTSPDGEIIDFTLDRLKKVVLSSIKMLTQDMAHYCQINSASYCEKMLNL